MFTLADLQTKRVVSTGHTWDEVLVLKAASNGELVHYTTSDIEGTPKPNLTNIVKGSTKLFKAEYLSWDVIREVRQAKLEGSDWRATIDYPGSDQQEWLDYRKELRELPQKYSRVEDIVLPEEPNV